ncbi:antirestriction protein ArdA [Sphingobium sp. AN641]|uniref:antirestriction protein ArdA n=1 Tax=Sphingobium sp. AN641 TaxID=3133443 RepID=UPI0030C1A456
METAPEPIAPRIYVACLAAYNNGVLHGAWIEAKQEAWAIYDGIRAMLDISPITDAEEWAIHDHEGFEGIELCEYAGIEGVAEKAAFIAAHGKLGAELFTYYGSLAEARDALEDRYHGQFESVADFMQESTEGSMTIPKRLQYYIDWQAMARDAELSGDLFTIQTAHDQVHVFAGG